MRSTTLRILFLLACCAAPLSVFPLVGGAPPRTGPETEKRFPPLKLPAGFKATLFACDPLIEYPSAIALGPRPGTLFLAADYMTGLGTEIVRRDEIRLVEDTDGDGYADRAPVYAKGFNSIEGLTYHDGTVYAMHAPFLTALRDTDGDGIADERRDLLSGLGLPPEQNPVRLHCANGLVMGHDGWLYLALGDHGCDVKRPEGDRLVLEGGGILRCRPDGKDLHVFASGLRNIYDVALDDELNVFVRDNENDGGDYKIRVCHSFHGADHGYPYLYYERPREALAPLADLGLGSSAGGVCYLERQFPAEYRGNLFFCEWGRSLVRYRPERAGSGFKPLKELEFAAGADNDPYGFKPTDVVVDHDGSLLVADWADGQRPLRGRGRVYRISYSSPPNNGGKAVKEPRLAQLDSESYYERSAAQLAIQRQGREGMAAMKKAVAEASLGVRGRLHAVWILARVGGTAAVDELFNTAGTDPDPRVRAQAVRAIADLTDPVLTRHRLESAPGDAPTAARLAALAPKQDGRVLLELVVALGRLHWDGAPAWLRQHVSAGDPALLHAAQQTLRRSANWPDVLKLLDEPDGVVRSVALAAIADRAVPEVVDGLIRRLEIDREPGRRREYADALTRVYKKPGPWVYWGYRPSPRPANTVAWDRTEAIEKALDRVLADPDHAVRLVVLRRMQREKVPARLTTLERWLGVERRPEAVAAVVESLRERPAAEVRPHLALIVGSKEHDNALRLTALALLAGGVDVSSEGQLLQIAATIEDGPVLADLLLRVAQRRQLDVNPLLVRKVNSPKPEVRAAAVEALAGRSAAELREPLLKLLEDADPRVRRAAAAAAGTLALRTSADQLLKLARDADPDVRRASLDALRSLREPRALPIALAALQEHQTELSALDCVGDLGGYALAQPVVELAKRNPSAEVLVRAVRILTRWGDKSPPLLPGQRGELDRGMAEIQGTHGLPVRWRVTGPLAGNEASALIDRYTSPAQPPAGFEEATPGWRTVFATGTDCSVNPGKGTPPAKSSSWMGYTEVAVPGQTLVQFLASASGTLRVWLNGREVHHRNQPLAFQIDSDRFTGTLEKGVNRILVQVGSPKDSVDFHLRFRRKSSVAEHEQLTQAALTRRGDPERGRKLFLNAEKSQCVKCHRIGDQGERIGPELTGVGSRFTRIYLIESILEPSRAIAPSYQTLVVNLKNGRVLSGVKVSETADVLVLADNQGQKHDIKKADVEEQGTQPLSTMPEGLEKKLSTDEFIDLVAFLTGLKETRTR